MEPLPHFPFFPDPLRENVFEKSSEACDICGRSRGMVYSASRYGSADDVDDLVICPWCIADGGAAARGVTFNDGTIYPCHDGVPQLSPDDLAMVEGRTPGFVTWQGNHWMICCGRACIYLGEPDEGDLQGRWASAVPSMYKNVPWPAEQVAEHVTQIRRGGSPAAYVFQCQVCGKLSGYWDCD